MFTPTTANYHNQYSSTAEGYPPSFGGSLSSVGDGVGSLASNGAYMYGVGNGATGSSYGPILPSAINTFCNQTWRGRMQGGGVPQFSFQAQAQQQAAAMSAQQQHQQRLMNVGAMSMAAGLPSQSDPRVVPIMRAEREKEIQRRTICFVAAGSPPAGARKAAEQSVKTMESRGTLNFYHAALQMFMAQNMLSPNSASPQAIQTQWAQPSSFVSPMQQTTARYFEGIGNLRGAPLQVFSQHGPVPPPQATPPPIPNAVGTIVASAKENIRKTRFGAQSPVATASGNQDDLLATLSHANRTWAEAVFNKFALKPLAASGISQDDWKSMLPAFVASRVSDAHDDHPVERPLPEYQELLNFYVSFMQGESPRAAKRARGHLFRDVSSNKPKGAEGKFPVVFRKAPNSSHRRVVSRSPSPTAKSFLPLGKHISFDSPSSTATSLSESMPQPLTGSGVDEDENDPTNHQENQASFTGNSIRAINVGQDKKGQNNPFLPRGVMQHPNRKQHFKKSKKKANDTSDKMVFSAEEFRKREGRMKRFGETECAQNDDKLLDGRMGWEALLALNKSATRIIGRSQDLEKRFLRLCGPPDPALVRPEGILKASFEHLVKRWNREKNWSFAEEQFRCIRQDLTVQCVRNSFVISVYETNARIALENGDLGQFNQCQTQLVYLYKQIPAESTNNRMEFLCYRILYMALQNMRLDLLKLASELTGVEKLNTAVQFAVSIRRILTEGNLYRLFSLIDKKPLFHCRLLIEMFFPKLRVQFLLTLAKGFYSLPISAVRKLLLFSSESECLNFLRSQNVVFCDTPSGVFQMDCRQSHSILQDSPLLRAKKVKVLG